MANIDNPHNKSRRADVFLFIDVPRTSDERRIRPTIL